MALPSFNQVELLAVVDYIFHVTEIFLLLIQIEPDRAASSVGFLLSIDVAKNSRAGRGRDTTAVLVAGF